MKLTSGFILAVVFALKATSSLAMPHDNHNDVGHVHSRDLDFEVEYDARDFEDDILDMDARDLYDTDDLEERDFDDDVGIEARDDFDDFEEVAARAIPPGARGRGRSPDPLPEPKLIQVGPKPVRGLIGMDGLRPKFPTRIGKAPTPGAEATMAPNKPKPVRPIPRRPTGYGRLGSAPRGRRS